ncbi:hypothetical protein QYM36_017518 [Artemia franciscana]|uniref:Transposase n=1 Tax=Artemia franciscana TaxID=6661 RepID=A0AA88L1I8_ARTSF|nr:hypothetical protein QYM36_017518 [Artemia franciscana]
MFQVEFLESERGHRKVALDGFIYVKQKELLGGVVSYECDRRRKRKNVESELQCRAKIKILNNILIGRLHDHTHPPDPARVEARRRVSFLNSSLSSEAIEMPEVITTEPQVDIMRNPEEIQSIDEQMIPFKGRIGFRQYLKDKPHSWGVKVFTRASISGIVYDIEIYTGKGAVEISELGQGTDVVLRLVENLPRFMNFKLFFDNFYTGIDLIHKLRVEYGIESCGTIRSNRMRGAVLDTDANMKKKGRGSVDFRFERHSEVSVVKWYDNKLVHLASSYCAVTPIDKCQRWDGTTRKYVEVDRPRIVRDYNKSMGGVDLADMFLELYRTDIRSKKWYMRIELTYQRHHIYSLGGFEVPLINN